jgi:polar amino acid transport system substrate-binding protein
MRTLFVILLCMLLQPSVALALPNSITLVADDWCPYNCDPASDKPGYAVEIAKAIFEPNGIHVHYEVTSWSRALKETKHGKYHAVIAATKEEAAGFVFPHSSIGVSQYHFYTTQQSDWKFTNLSALQTITLGVIDGYNYDEAIDGFILKHRDHRNHIQIVGGDSASMQNIKKLLAGRIDVMLEDKNVANNLLQSMGLSGQLRDAGQLDPTIDADEYVYIAFSPKDKNSPTLASLFDKGMKRLRDSGELKAILSRYDVSDWSR